MIWEPEEIKRGPCDAESPYQGKLFPSQEKFLKLMKNSKGPSKEILDADEDWELPS